MLHSVAEAGRGERVDRVLRLPEAGRAHAPGYWLESRWDEEQQSRSY